MSEWTITHRGTVYPWQCDHMGHMNVMYYAGRFDEASWQLLSAIGLIAAKLREGGCGMAAVEQNTRYFREVYAGDPITIRSRIVHVAEKSVRFRHEMTNDLHHELVATSEIVGVYFDARIRKACPLPAEIRRLTEAMTEAITDEPLPCDAGVTSP